jgi:hypothetical protein
MWQFFSLFTGTFPTPPLLIWSHIHVIIVRNNTACPHSRRSLDYAPSDRDLWPFQFFTPHWLKWQKFSEWISSYIIKIHSFINSLKFPLPLSCVRLCVCVRTFLPSPQMDVISWDLMDITSRKLSKFSVYLNFQPMTTPLWRLCKLVTWKRNWHLKLYMHVSQR